MLPQPSCGSPRTSSTQGLGGEDLILPPPGRSPSPSLEPRGRSCPSRHSWEACLVTLWRQAQAVLGHTHPSGDPGRGPGQPRAGSQGYVWGEGAPHQAGSDLTSHQHLSAVASATVPCCAPQAPTVICRAHGAAGRETEKATHPLACMCALGLCFLFDGRLEVFTLSQNKGNCDFCFPFAYLIPCTFDSGITLLTGMISP